MYKVAKSFAPVKYLKIKESLNWVPAKMGTESQKMKRFVLKLTQDLRWLKGCTLSGSESSRTGSTHFEGFQVETARVSFK